MEPAKKVPKKGKRKKTSKQTTFFFRFQPFISSSGLYHGWVPLLQKPTCWVTFCRKFLLLKVTHLPLVGSFNPKNNMLAKLNHETPNLRGEIATIFQNHHLVPTFFSFFRPMWFFVFSTEQLGLFSTPPHVNPKGNDAAPPQGTSPVWMPARCVPGRWEGEWKRDPKSKVGKVTLKRLGDKKVTAEKSPGHNSQTWLLQQFALQENHDWQTIVSSPLDGQVFFVHEGVDARIKHHEVVKLQGAAKS